MTLRKFCHKCGKTTEFWISPNAKRDESNNIVKDSNGMPVRETKCRRCKA